MELFSSFGRQQIHGDTGALGATAPAINGGSDCHMPDIQQLPALHSYPQSPLGNSLTDPGAVVSVLGARPLPDPGIGNFAANFSLPRLHSNWWFVTQHRAYRR
jgi:hypothetical protein